MARPKRGNYAYGDAGQARYRKAVQEYNAKMKKLREEKTKIDSTKKNIEKQKTANKKAGTTTKTKTVAKTKSTPTSTAAKGKTLATGKTTSKTKAIETPKTKTATKTRTRTRTQTKSKSTPKSKVTEKTTGRKTSKNLKIKGDRYVRKPQIPKDKNYGKPVKKYQRTVVRPKDGRNYGNPEKGKSTNTTGSTVKGKIKQGIDSGVKKGKEVASQVKQSGKKFSDILKVGNRQKNPPATNPQQKFFQTINQGGRKVRVLSKKYLKKNKPFKTAAGKVVQGVKNNPGSVVRGAKNIVQGGIYGGLAEAGLRRLTKPVTNRITKGVRNYIRKNEYGDKPLTLEESNALTKKVNNMSGAERKAYLKKQKERRKVYKQSKNTNTSNQSSTTKNINKQKKDNNNKLKVNKLRGLPTQYSSNAAKKKQDFNAPTGTKKVDKRFPSFRENPEANRKLQDERIKNKDTKETYSRKLSIKAKKNQQNNTTTSKTPRPGSARAKLREKNIKRFGEAHVNRLVAKNKEFQAIKKIKNREERKRRRETYRQKYGR